jgi:hypothetical protein
MSFLAGILERESAIVEDVSRFPGQRAGQGREWNSGLLNQVDKAGGSLHCIYRASVDKNYQYLLREFDVSA